MEQEMRYAYEVFREGSFSKAAEKLFITQPALSIAIQKLEADIGMALFDRSRRPLKLTAAGEIYINTICKIRDLEHDLECQIHDIQNLNTGSIRLGGSHYLNAYILPDILTGFGRLYPGIRLELVEEGSNVLAKMLSERRLDLTFSCNTVFMREFERYEVFHDHILLAIAKDHPANGLVPEARLSAEDIKRGVHLSEGCPSVSLKVFRDLEYILLTEGNNLHDRAFKMFQEAGFSPKVKLMLAQLVTAYRLAASGLAAALVSDRLVRDPKVSLYFYKLDSEETVRRFYALLPNRLYTSHATKMFIQYLLLNV